MNQLLDEYLADARIAAEQENSSIYRDQSVRRWSIDGDDYVVEELTSRLRSPALRANDAPERSDRLHLSMVNNFCMDLPEELPSSQDVLKYAMALAELEVTEHLRASSERLTKFHLNIDEPLAAAEVLPHLLRIPEAIISSPCITELSMSRIMFSTLHIIQAILEQLAVRRPATLKHLKLDFGRRRDSVLLQDLLPMPAFLLLAVNLKELNLCYVQFDEECCVALFVTLQNSALTGQNSSTSLVLNFCTFDVDACNLLATLMRRPSGKRSGDNDDRDDSAAVQVSFLDCDSLLPFCLLGSFQNALNCRYQVYRLALIWDDDWYIPIAMAYYLPKALYLRELTWTSDMDLPLEETERLRTALSDNVPRSFWQVPRSLQSRQFLDALRQNGSLHHFDARWVRPQPFTAEMNRQIEAYLTRNRELPHLLANPRVDDEDKDDAASSTPDPKTDLKDFPRLFLGAFTAPIMAPSNLLRGLSAATASSNGELCLGPFAVYHRGSKRCSS